MSNYTILTDWVGKDSLSDSDANKVISGSDFQTEFEAVRTAVDSKADSTDNATQTYVTTEIASHSVSPSLTGTPTSPTATVGTDTTQLATTEYVKAEIEKEVFTDKIKHGDVQITLYRTAKITEFGTDDIGCPFHFTMESCR